MSPNIILPFLYIAQPKRWTSLKESSKDLLEIRHCTEPVPGTYTYTPGRGWSLTAVDTAYGSETIPPHPIVWSRVLHRYLLEAEYRQRVRTGKFLAGAAQQKEVGFFRLDDGTAWVHCWDHAGAFIPGPYERVVVDEMSGKFRPMLRRDDPVWRAKHRGEESCAASVRSEVGLGSCCGEEEGEDEGRESLSSGARATPSRSSTGGSRSSSYLEVRTASSSSSSSRSSSRRKAAR